MCGFNKGMATFGFLIFHFISIRVMRLWKKKDNSQSRAYLYFLPFMFLFFFFLTNFISKLAGTFTLSSKLLQNMFKSVGQGNKEMQ